MSIEQMIALLTVLIPLVIFLSGKWFSRKFDKYGEQLKSTEVTLSQLEVIKRSADLIDSYTVEVSELLSKIKDLEANQREQKAQLEKMELVIEILLFQMLKSGIKPLIKIDDIAKISVETLITIRQNVVKTLTKNEEQIAFAITKFEEELYDLMHGEPIEEGDIIHNEEEKIDEILD